MRAIILKGFGGLDNLVYDDLPKPLPKDGEVVIAVKGFGINHAEMHMRRGEWAEAAEVSGIECVGIVDSCPGGEFPVGAKVAALMGGLGRTINGSYAQYTRVRAANVALIDSELSWAALAALPETFAVAWTCLFRNLDLKAGQTLVLRGATSSLGRPHSRWRWPPAHESSRPRAAGDASRCSSNWARRESSWSGATWQATFPRAAGSTPSSISSATAPSSTPWTCCAAAARPAWPVGWAGWSPSGISTRCCAWHPV
ncbi:alcohol dehydrogenase GroES-like domain protein [Mycobacterium intracellulare 1956]|uniref:Alcohol dehydrogenase GroES-like domain protein n=1 Tax=Mycobacterium intracellulare 1956 TaxID=1299331 RepID=X8CN98_MYCIT|nr:alcohol dehydrogenase GroES-like domain protein [Mycobacterium intracellulare 1956]